MNKPHNKAVYAIADALLMTIEADVKTGALTGLAEHTIDIMALKVPLRMEIVSSMHTAKASFALVHVKGDLGFMLAAGASGSPLLLYVLNVARMSPVAGWFEAMKPESSVDAMAKLGDAVVAKFEERDGRWKPYKG